jgi:muramoyltetrapeptide carboxypeptidase
MICPQYLKKGSKIVIVSPAGTINKEFVLSAKKYLSAAGFDVSISPFALNEFYQFSGTDDERLSDLQDALNNDLVDAILCSRGGYGLVRIIDKINFSKFIANPKWIIGFSDITNLHLAVNKLRVMSIHGQMAKAFYKNINSESIFKLLDILQGEKSSYNIPCHFLNIFGNAEAELVGGNLSIIYSLQGTKYEIDTNNKILFIEDLNEYLYHLDRIMLNLKLSGKLINLKGLVVGAFSDMLDNKKPFGKNAYEIILEHVSEYGYPVCFDFPAGHIAENMPLIMGARYSLSVTEDNILLTNSANK